MKNKSLITSLILAVAALCSKAQTTPFDFFLMDEANEAVFCTEPINRLDMVDYFRSGLDTGTRLVHNQSGRILNATDRSLTWQITPGITSTLYVVGKGKKPRLLVVETIDDPAPDSRLMWFDARWNPIKAPVDIPVLADWLTPEGQKDIKDVENWLPYMTATARLSDDAKAIIYTNTLKDRYLSSEDLANIDKWIKPQITVKL